jgi:threonine dehydrogenase-like Zn-dependent dehydrogenase
MESGQVSLREVPLPNRDSRFALVRMLRAGICNTDLELQRGYYNFSGIPGHEFVGEVLECASPELLGKRVVGEINLACGGCQFCATGLSRHCARRVVLGILNHPGAFAEFLALPESNLRLVPDEISDQTAVFVEPLAAACEILEQLHIPVGERVAVLVPIHEGCDVFCQEKELMSKLESKLGDDHKVTEFESGSNDLFAECCHIVLVGVADLFDKPMSP